MRSKIATQSSTGDLFLALLAGGLGGRLLVLGTDAEDARELGTQLALVQVAAQRAPERHRDMPVLFAHDDDRRIGLFGEPERGAVAGAERRRSQRIGGERQDA